MDNTFFDSWQENSKNFAGFITSVTEKNLALTQHLFCNLPAKQFSKFTETVLQLGCKTKDSDGKDVFDESLYALPIQAFSETYIHSIKELNEILLAGFQKGYESQISIWKSYIDLLSGYLDQLNRSRGVDDVVAVNFDYMTNLMATAKSGALESLTVGESIKTALIAWSDNSVEALEEEVEEVTAD